MIKAQPFLLSIFLMASTVMSGCAIKPDIPTKEEIRPITLEQRTQQLLKSKKWQLRGKIAFIQKVENEKDKRESASMTWQVNEEKQTQELNLTSYLGINVLHLESTPNQHLIKVDGNEYQGTNLPLLIYSLTGLTLPTEALTFWLKGLPYRESDKLKTDKTTQLPMSIVSYYNNALWQINYNHYRVFDGISMATNFTIKRDKLLIKVAVKNWSFAS